MCVCITLCCHMSKFVEYFAAAPGILERFAGLVQETEMNRGRVDWTPDQNT